MKKELWKLATTYELLLELGQTVRPIRIEVFKSEEACSRFRARIWVQNMYNLYPAYINTGPQGQDLHQVHSSDELNQDITYIVEDPAFLEGVEFESEGAFVESLQAHILKYQKAINAN